MIAIDASAAPWMSLDDVSDVRNPWEVTISGSGSSNKTFDAGSGSVSASIGYYLTDMLEASVRQLVSVSDPGPNQASAFNGATRLALDANLGSGTVRPYLGANFGWVYGDSVEETFVAGPEGGLKVYLKDDVFFHLGLEYLFFFDDGDQAVNAFDDGQFIYALGMGVRF
jgi:hypothetical protein